MTDPMNGDWAKLDQSPAASAQMIEWYAPETAKVLRESRSAQPKRVNEEKYYGYVITWDDVAADIWWAGREFVQQFPTPEQAKAEIDRWRRDVK